MNTTNNIFSIKRFYTGRGVGDGTGRYRRVQNILLVGRVRDNLELFYRNSNER